MSLFLASVYPILKLALIVLAGYVLRKRNIIPEGASPVLSKAVIYVFLPCLVIAKLGGQPSLAKFPGWYWLPISAWVTMLISVGLAWMLSVGWNRERLFERRVLASMCMIPNASYVPLPIVFTLWPGDETMLALVFFYMMGVTPVLWSLGPAILGGGIRAFSWKRLITPPLVAFLIAFGMLATGLPTVLRNVTIAHTNLLDLVLGPLDMVADATIPLVLLVLGGDLAMLPSGGRPNFRFQAILIGVPLIVIPILGLLIVPHLGLPGPVTAIILIECLTPAAMSIVVQAQMYAPGETSDLVGRGLLYMYVGALITMPVFLSIYHMQYGELFPS